MKIVKLEKTIAIIVFVILFLIIFSTPVTIWLAKRAEKQKLLLAYQQQIAQTATMTGGNIQPVTQTQPIAQPIAQPVQPVTQTQPIAQPIAQPVQPVTQTQQVQPVTQTQQVQQSQPIAQTTTNNVDCFI